MSNSTSTLTHDLLERIMELRADGLGYRGIVAICRAEGHKVSIPDITHWRKNDADDPARGESFRGRWEQAEDARRSAKSEQLDVMINEIVEIADAPYEEIEEGKVPGLAERADQRALRRLKIQAREKAINAELNREQRMDGLQRVHLSGEVGGGTTLILPESKLFGEGRGDEGEDD